MIGIGTSPSGQGVNTREAGFAFILFLKIMGDL
jgi:hypothetical protein